MSAVVNRSLFLDANLRTAIVREGEGAYPLECCGILYGRDADSGRVVESVEAVANAFDSAERHHRFAISPLTLMRAEQRCGDGQLVIGFYHSHPDHPARPSEFDRQHAWPFYSYLIVSVEKGRAGEMSSWVLDEANARFDPQRIEP